MTKSKKNYISKKNTTKKVKKESCNDLVYKSFEGEFKHHLRFGNIQTKKIIKEYLEDLNARFRKNTINPPDKSNINVEFVH